MPGVEISCDVDDLKALGLSHRGNDNPIGAAQRFAAGAGFTPLRFWLSEATAAWTEISTVPELVALLGEPIQRVRDKARPALLPVLRDTGCAFVTSAVESGKAPPPSKGRILMSLPCFSMKTLSYSGKNRGGAGVPGSGRGAWGRSKSSLPFSSW